MAKKIQKWTIILAVEGVTGYVDSAPSVVYGLYEFCLVGWRSACRSLEIVVPRLCNKYTNTYNKFTNPKYVHKIDRQTMGGLHADFLAPLRLFRNLGMLTFTESAIAYRFMGTMFDTESMFEEQISRFLITTPRVKSSSLLPEASMIAMFTAVVTSSVPVEPAWSMYLNLVDYAQAFNRCCEAKILSENCYTAPPQNKDGKHFTDHSLDNRVDESSLKMYPDDTAYFKPRRI